MVVGSAAVIGAELVARRPGGNVSLMFMSRSQDTRMNKLVVGGLVAFFAASPAFASGGLLCRTAGARPVEVRLVVSHTVVSTLVSARLIDGARDIPVALAQAWIDPNEVRVDLTDRNAQRHELRLRAKRNGRYYDGSLWRSGKRRWVRCREG